ncbi:uncharacterized protein HD556DRAFT_1443439 [Suillus plorans]|uniref:Uncharacterized protein n=1 Tax=Suillus plorans TaxID=116603 RepID=A0A9P7AR32_9AGAM|nr:uncharacterized protein HD556DRAFT_1443439 [Suillus plorans]KAG1793648.1 hypothetical protein HD556DRAFT_1443439 [Suillus plorans]
MNLSDVTIILFFMLLILFQHSRTYHRALFYGTACDEAILTYVPQDLDGIIRVHMWIGGAHFSNSHGTPPSTVFIDRFPGSSLSLFRDAYSVVFLSQDPLLPLNSAHLSCTDSLNPWRGDILVLRHIGHNPQLVRSMSLDEKALVDAFLASLSVLMLGSD